jgi:hypothetical protein
MAVRVFVIQPGVMLSDGGVQEKPGHDYGLNTQIHQVAGVGRMLIAHRGEDDAHADISQ